MPVAQKIEPGLFGDIVKTPFSVVLVEAVGQAAGLADVDFVEPVAIHIARGDAVAAVNIDARGRIQARPPVRDAAQELLAERWIRAKEVGSHIAEERALRLHQHFP